MKKINFLKGMSAAFALATVALATTFTSCEKENFNVDVELANATAQISPVVLYVETDGNVSDVTTQATLNPSAASMTYTGNPSLAAQTVQVTATYNGVSATISVTIPALSAGQNAYLTPTIMLQAPAEEEDETYNYTTTRISSTTEQVFAENIDNGTDYYWTSSRTYQQKSGVTAATTVAAEGANEVDLAYLNNFASTILDSYQEAEDVIEFNVWAHSRTTVSVSYEITTWTWEIKKVAQGSTRSTEEILIGTITCENYTTTRPEIKENQLIPGHGHSPAGHGHGHNGHGDDANAGGGIIMAD